MNRRLLVTVLAGVVGYEAGNMAAGVIMRALLRPAPRQAALTVVRVPEELWVPERFTVGGVEWVRVERDGRLVWQASDGGVGLSAVEAGRIWLEAVCHGRA